MAELEELKPKVKSGDLWAKVEVEEPESQGKVEGWNQRIDKQGIQKDWRNTVELRVWRTKVEPGPMDMKTTVELKRFRVLCRITSRLW